MSDPFRVALKQTEEDMVTLLLHISTLFKGAHVHPTENGLEYILLKDEALMEFSRYENMMRRKYLGEGREVY